MHPDPYYLSPPAQWIATTTAAFTGLEIITDDNLPGNLACRVDHDARLVQIAPGLSLNDFHWAVCRAVVRDRFGPEYAPEFAMPDRRLRALPTPRGALQRPATCPECGHWLSTGQSQLS